MNVENVLGFNAKAQRRQGARELPSPGLTATLSHLMGEGGVRAFASLRPCAFALNSSKPVKPSQTSELQPLAFPVRQSLGDGGSLQPSPLALGVVILGAGASVRMGTPKLLLRWGQTSVIGHLIDQWEALGARQIAVVCRRTDRLLAAELRRLDFPTRHRIVNPAPERGMFSSIVCAARWRGWEKGLTAWVIALGDQPHLKMKTLRALLAHHRKHPQAICQPKFAGHRCHPVVLPRQGLLELGQSSARTLKTFLKQSSLPQIECPLDDDGLRLDMDFPADYKKMSPVKQRVT